MQGYAQRSNQRLPKYQEPPPPYQPVRNSHHNLQQAHFNPQPYPAEQARRSNGQQEVVNNWSAHQAIRSGNADAYAPAFQRFDGNQTCPQQPLTRHQLHYRPSNVAAHNAKVQASDNPNGHNRHYGQFNTQSSSYVASHQIYGITETAIAQVDSGQPRAYWTQNSDHRSSRTVSNDNTRGCSSHISDNGRSCQQLQPRPNHIYPQQPQQFSGQRSGQQQTVPTPGHTLHYNPATQNRTTVQRMINNQAQSRTSVGYTSPNSVTLPPAGPHRNISPPSNNVQQSQPALMSKANPNVLPAQDRNNQNSAGHPTAYANVQTCNVNQNAENQRAPTSEAQLNPTSRPFNLKAYLKSNLYYILCSNDEEQGSKNNHQPSDGRLQNTCPDRSDVRSANSHSQLLSESNLQCTAEPPHKRMNLGQIQRYYWKLHPSNNTNVPKNSGLQSSLPGTQQMAVPDLNSTGNGHGGQKQIEIQYVTDPAVCLEAVFALQKVLQVHKAVAIVPPISQQPSNTEKIDDACTRTDDSPPLKIDAIWSLNPEKLSEESLPAVQEDDKMSLESKTTNAADSCMMESSDTCSDNPTAGCQNDVRQSDCDSSEAVFELSNVPLVAYTLGNLRDLINSLEMIESSAQCPKKPKSVCKQILDLYWNGDVVYLKKHLKELHKERLYFNVESVKDETSVVFESITPENFKKVAHCEIVTDELCSSFEQYRSSWLNVDGQPADIGKVLSEPLSDYITFSKEASDNICVPADNLGVNSLKHPEVTTFNGNERAEPDSESPGSIFTPSAGNDRTETDTENKGHSDAENPGVTFPTEEEAFEQGDNMQNDKHLNTKPSADLSPSEDLRADTTTKENLSQEHIRDLTIDQKESEPHVHLDSKRLHDKPLQLVYAVSDAVDESLTTKPSGNFTDTWQVEDISDDDSSDNMKAPTNFTHTMQVENISEDENLNNMEILTNSADTLQVENISEDENSNNMEILTNSADTLQVENISEDENLNNMEILTNSADTLQVENISEDENSNNMEILTNSADTLQVKNISEDENSDNMEAVTKSTDRFIVEDISNDENSSDDSLLMDVTVLSSEEALTFFQQLEKESQSDIKMTSTQSNVDRLELVASSPSQPNHEYNKAEICFRCGINNILTSKIDSDRELFCPSCWDKAPSLELEMDPCSPKSNETDVLGSEKLEDNCSPSVEMEVLEPVIASTDVRIAEELNEKSKDDTVENSPEIESTVEQEIVKIQPHMTKDENSENISMPKLHRNETDVQGSDTESEKLQNDGPPSLEMEVLEPVFASTATNSADEELTEKPKGDKVVNSVSEQKTPEIQCTVEQELAKIQPDKTKDDNKPSSKSAFLKRKRKPKFHSDDSVLFAPDIVLKKKRPEIKNHSHHPKAVSAVNRPGGQSQNFTKNVTNPSQERQDPLLHAVTEKTSQNHKENVREKQFSYSTQFMTKQLHRSNTTPEVQSDNLSKKNVTTEKKKVKFALYGSKNEHHRVQGRKFLPPATLTVTNACNDVSKNMNQSFPEGRRLSAPATLSTLSDYSDVISAKQKVHNQWSSMFIPQGKKTSPSKSPTKGETPKKKTLKAHELLKSNMPALKNQMVQRKLSSQDISKSVQKH